MYPHLLRSPALPSYGIMLLLGLVIAWWLTRRRARASGLDASHIDLLAPLLVAAGLAGSLIAAWLVGPDGITGSVGGMVGGHGGDLSGGDIGSRGRALYGGLIGAVVLGIGYAVLARLPLGKLGDAFAVPLAVGIALGRVGCFLAGCCFGDVCVENGRLAKVAGLTERAGTIREQIHTLPAISGTAFPLAVRFPAESPAHHQHTGLGLIPTDAATALPVHPVQLYEAGAVLMLATLVALVYRQNAGKPRGIPGEAFLTIGLGYAAIRFTAEFLRADNPVIAAGPVAGPVAGTAAQWTALATAPLCLSLLIARRRLADRLGLRIEKGANAG